MRSNAFVECFTSEKMRDPLWTYLYRGDARASGNSAPEDGEARFKIQNGFDKIAHTFGLNRSRWEDKTDLLCGSLMEYTACGSYKR